MKNFDEFIDQIIKDKGLDSEEPEVVAQIHADLSDSLENRINAMIITNIPEDKMDDFNKILDSKDDKKIQDYIGKVVPNIQEKVAMEMAEFRAYYLA
jgi:ATP phosphoribosyltransferase